MQYCELMQRNAPHYKKQTHNGSGRFPLFLLDAFRLLSWLGPVRAAQMLNWCSFKTEDRLVCLQPVTQITTKFTLGQNKTASYQQNLWKHQLKTLILRKKYEM